jgi:serine/threonine protein kinase
VWSAGVVTFILLTGKPPFNAKNKMELYQVINNSNPDYTSQEWLEVS